MGREAVRGEMVTAVKYQGKLHSYRPDVARSLGRFLVGMARPPRVRTMREFAEQEIIIPNGPHEGERFDCNSQPYTRLWLLAVDSGCFNRVVATGPRQTGKTVLAFVLPIMYHLFEVGEDVICAVPSLNMVEEKWTKDILPVIEKSRYAKELPKKGGGSRGGKTQLVRFNNGKSLRFMTAGGGDKSRAGSTARVVVVTETDGFDDRSETSDEADKLTQLLRCTNAFGENEMIYLECTVTTEEGRTWKELKKGTDSRIALHCPHCREYVAPDREDLRGWENAEDEADAAEHSRWTCCECGATWSEHDRRRANEEAVLLHRGQTVGRDGTVHGDPPRTRCFSLRWHAFHNMFRPASQIGVEEWHASRDTDADNVERDMLQFVWALPYIPEEIELAPLDADTIRRRQSEWARGVVPDDCIALTVGCDTGKWKFHYVVFALLRGGRSHIVEYGVIDTDADHLSEHRSALLALRELDDICKTGWAVESGGTRSPDCVFVDSKYEEHRLAVYEWSRRHNDQRHQPYLGRGSTQMIKSYTHPTALTDKIRVIGRAWYMATERKERVKRIHISADHWKSWIHDRLSVLDGSDDSMTLYRAPRNEHITFSKHLVAEKRKEDFTPSRGRFVTWETVSRQNHYFDACYSACAAADYVIVMGDRLKKKQGAGSKAGFVAA